MSSKIKKISIEKLNGRFYTPDFMVKNILDMSGYYGVNIIKKHAIDNSCGDGAFLVEMVFRYCESATKANFSKQEIVKQLETYIHGIEIDNIELNKCIYNVNKVLAEFDIPNVDWDIKCSDTMNVDEYDGKMDYVVGNPPYVRVHNVGDSFERIKEYSFAKNGMTDMYIVFYEIGIRMLNNNGVLGYITPSSFFNSIAGENMRKYLVKHNLIEKIIDLKHYQAFDATTYNAIMILKKNKEEKAVYYYEFDEKNKIPYYVDSIIEEDFFICNKFYFSNKKDLQLLKKIFNNNMGCDIKVKNGYATLCDNVFIGEFKFKSKYLIPVIKASTGKHKQLFYPYGTDSKFVEESEIQKDLELYEYLMDKKILLTKRSNEKDNNTFWYAFGRSQAINDTYKNKISINTLLRTKKDLKIISAPAGVGVYSGLYLTSDNIDMEQIKRILISNDFISYITLLGKYKSGGYYTFSSKDVKAYLDYKLNYMEKC